MSEQKASIWSEKIIPVVRVALVQVVIFSGIFGNIAGWLVMALLVDTLGWLDIDYKGKTLETINPDGRILGMLVLLLVNLAIIWLAWRWLERKRLKDMLLDFSGGQTRYLGWGILAGLGEALVVFLILWAVGGVSPEWGLKAVSIRRMALAAGWFAASCVLAPLVEESLYRGYWFQNVQRGWGTVAAIIVSALLFGGFHLLNPDAELLGALNIALSAVTYALGLLLFKSLWLPIGWHAAWNFAQFFLGGMPNSGFSVADISLKGTTLLLSEPAGEVWLSGGNFGMEASLVRTIVLVGIIGGMIWLQRKQNASQ